MGLPFQIPLELEDYHGMIAALSLHAPNMPRYACSVNEVLDMDVGLYWFLQTSLLDILPGDTSDA